MTEPQKNPYKYKDIFYDKYPYLFEIFRRNSWFVYRLGLLHKYNIPNPIIKRFLSTERYYFKSTVKEGICVYSPKQMLKYYAGALRYIDVFEYCFINDFKILCKFSKEFKFQYPDLTEYTFIHDFMDCCGWACTKYTNQVIECSLNISRLWNLQNSIYESRLKSVCDMKKEKIYRFQIGNFDIDPFKLDTIFFTDIMEPNKYIIVEK